MAAKSSARKFAASCAPDIKPHLREQALGGLLKVRTRSLSAENVPSL